MVHENLSEGLKKILEVSKTLGKEDYINFGEAYKHLSSMTKEAYFKEKTGVEFAAVYKKNFSKLKSFLTNYSRDEEDAKDITNDAFMKALKDIDTYDRTKAGILTWIFTIGKNMMLQRIERKSKFSPIEQDTEIYNNQSLIADNLSDNIIREHNIMEKVDLIKKAITELPPRNAEVITMRQFKNMSYQDIADFYQNFFAHNIQLSDSTKLVGEYIKFEYENFTYSECLVKSFDSTQIIMEWNQEKMEKWEEQHLDPFTNEIKMNDKMIKIPFEKIQNVFIVTPLSTIKSQIRQSRILLTEKLSSKFQMLDSKTMYD